MRVKVINKRLASVLQKKRVCAYARVSTDSRRQEDSLENQMETYERLITGNSEYEFIGVFADQGISGYCENRPQFQRMMEKARAGEIDLIITKSISRFARNTVTVLKFARELGLEEPASIARERASISWTSAPFSRRVVSTSAG